MHRVRRNSRLSECIYGRDKTFLRFSERNIPEYMWLTYCIKYRKKRREKEKERCVTRIIIKMVWR